jgi:hypothetical protein
MMENDNNNNNNNNKKRARLSFGLTTPRRPVSPPCHHDKKKDNDDDDDDDVCKRLRVDSSSNHPASVPVPVPVPVPAPSFGLQTPPRGDENGSIIRRLPLTMIARKKASSSSASASALLASLRARNQYLMDELVRSRTLVRMQEERLLKCTCCCRKSKKKQNTVTAYTPEYLIWKEMAIERRSFFFGQKYHNATLPSGKTCKLKLTSATAKSLHVIKLINEDTNQVFIGSARWDRGQGADRFVFMFEPRCYLNDFTEEEEEKNKIAEEDMVVYKNNRVVRQMYHQAWLKQVKYLFRLAHVFYLKQQVFKRKTKGIWSLFKGINMDKKTIMSIMNEIFSFL